MLVQSEIDFTARKENNSFSQSLLEANAEKISGNCKKVYELLLKGHRLTVNGVVTSKVNWGLKSNGKLSTENLFNIIYDHIKRDIRTILLFYSTGEC
jgi:hypothetical protein